MKLPTIKRILREDVKDAPPWIDGLISPLNAFMDAVYQALNKNLTLNENIASFTTDISYATDATYPTTQTQIKFSNILRSRPTGVVLLQIYDKEDFLPPDGPVYIPWTLSNNLIVLHTVTGLTASKIYNLRLLVF